MESIVKKLFLSGCLVVGLAVSLTSFATYAADDPKAVTGDTSFKLTVQNALTLSNVTSENITAKPGDIATGSLVATVQSGTKFTLSLSASKPQLTLSNAAATADNTKQIPSASGLSTLSSNGWGVTKQGSSNDYDEITAQGAVFYTSTGPADKAIDVSLPVGVRTISTLPAGNYSTTVTVTAATAN